MAQDSKTLRVILACPGDVDREAQLLEAAIGRVNATLRAARADIHLDLGHWRTDARPGFHPDGPQGIVDQCLNIEDCDVLIAIFWKRFGTPVKNAQSGTEYEVRRGIASWDARGTPQIWLYFCQTPFNPKTKEETDQWSKVLGFRDEFRSSGL